MPPTVIRKRELQASFLPGKNISLMLISPGSISDLIFLEDQDLAEHFIKYVNNWLFKNDPLPLENPSNLPNLINPFHGKNFFVLPSLKFFFTLKNLILKKSNFFQRKWKKNPSIFFPLFEDFFEFSDYLPGIFDISEILYKKATSGKNF